MTYPGLIADSILGHHLMHGPDATTSCHPDHLFWLRIAEDA